MNQDTLISRPAVTTNIVVFSVFDDRLQVLLVRHPDSPADTWSLPGGLILGNEDLDDCAERSLKQQTGLQHLYLEQLYTFGHPARDPHQRVISVSYFALLDTDRVQRDLAPESRIECQWTERTTLPPLLYDHDRIVSKAHERLAAKLGYTTVALQLMPDKFTLSELQTVYELILGEPMDKRNFRKRIQSLDNIRETREEKRNGAHRPARLYRLLDRNRVDLIK